MNVSRNRRVLSGVAGLAIAIIAITACQSNSPSSAGASGSSARSSATTAAPVSDPNGESCTALDNLGYCPNDDPTPTPTDTGPTVLSSGDSEDLASASTNASEGSVTVTIVKVTTQPGSSYGNSPANGYYVIAKVTAKSDPSYADGFDVNALDFFALVNSQQYQWGDGNSFEALSDSQSNEDITATLGAGQSRTGYIAFDVPSRHGEIAYAPNNDGQPLAVWTY